MNRLPSISEPTRDPDPMASEAGALSRPAFCSEQSVPHPGLGKPESHSGMSAALSVPCHQGT